MRALLLSVLGLVVAAGAAGVGGFDGVGGAIGVAAGVVGDDGDGKAVVLGKQRAVSYDRDIRPILSDRCFMCHGGDAATRKAGMRLDVADGAEGAHTARDEWTPIKPGDLAGSEVWRRVTSEDEVEVMPPPESGKHALSAGEKALFKGWIEQGAAYQPHWSFEAPKRPVVPGAAGTGAAGGHVIDRFIDDSLSAAGMVRSARADKRTLLRRVFLDLTGLPPTPEELAAFESDTRPDAWEKWVDRLMNEEPYTTRMAERVAVAWLDLARYADTCGIHHDHGRSIWPWRDWVLKALKANMPFDQFVVEQLAGDLFANPTQDQLVATGFHRNTATSDEGGAIEEEYRFEYLVERASVTGSVFMGLTVGCARCHDHKFDPISAADFYSLGAFFNSLDEPGVYVHIQDKKHAYIPFIAVTSDEMAATLVKMRSETEQTKKDLETLTPEEETQRRNYPGTLRQESGVVWSAVSVVSAESRGGATMTVKEDGSVLATGASSERDEYTITLKSDATGSRLVVLEALTDASVADERVGRAPNGNAVLSGIAVEAVSVADETKRQDVKLVWAWADIEQRDGDFRVVNALAPGVPGEGWAVGSHQTKGPRTAVFLADAPFGFVGGTKLVVKLGFDSKYTLHSMARVRLSVGSMAETALWRLPMAVSAWYLAGPFEATDRATVFEQNDGPEADGALDLGATFGGKKWAYLERMAENRPVLLPAGVANQYVARRVYAPTARTLNVHLGSDDGIAVYVGGKQQFANKTERSLAPDQETAKLEVAAGMSAVTMKIVNTGGDAGVYYREDAAPKEELDHTLVAALLPEAARSDRLKAMVLEASLSRFSPRHRELSARMESMKAELTAKEAGLPRTMVMKELAMARPMFVATRGQYDHPDSSRPVSPAVPKSLGSLAADAPRNRLGLAQWMMGKENPLTARVLVNRIWEQFFGMGIVKTTEDFGYQGEFPSHPELLDWLAMEFREGGKGWDQRAMMRLIVTSETYKQASRRTPEAAAADPENRLLAYFPRQRLSAEQIRDQALYVSGLLVEKMGGPSVQAPQPAGLWEEVSMPDSNTRVFVAGKGEERYRRTMYTFWKRASPPPSLLALDAPTREFCSVRRMTTNTPLQALALWNDEQFVEASRVLAARTLAMGGDDASRLADLYARCTGRKSDEKTAGALATALGAFRARYAGAGEDAKKLLAIGDAKAPAGVDERELAAWTLVASAVLNADAAIVKN